MRTGVVVLVVVALIAGILVGRRMGYEPSRVPPPISKPVPEKSEIPPPTPAPVEVSVRGQEILRIDIPGLPEGARPLELVPIPAGTFLMGSTDAERGRKFDEGPQHEVTIADDYFLGVTEVTQAQWKAVMGSIPELLAEKERGEGPNHPVYCVSWDDVQEFLTALNGLVTIEEASPAFRLPSEAEWEYACKGGTRSAFFFGDLKEGELDCQDSEAEALPGKRSDYMWFCWTSGANGFPNQTKMVGTLRPNQYGLYDMSGNLFEWCQDWSHSYVNAPDVGTAWEVPATDKRIIRGGSWANKAKDCRSAMRAQLVPEYQSEAVGFRIARTR